MRFVGIYSNSRLSAARFVAERARYCWSWRSDGLKGTARQMSPVTQLLKRAARGRFVSSRVEMIGIWVFVWDRPGTTIILVWESDFVPMRAIGAS